ncbi:MAG: dicarboxylate/amino acid:cation symporter, partial [Planctomycetota bacterium]|nr:dicarboxylate/amino acid:cation symporter [Planctomycetota bacterium]
GIAGIGETSRVGALGMKTVIYYLSTTFIAVAIGILLVNLIQPGVDFEVRGVVLPESVINQEGGFWEAGLQILRSIIPTNIFKAMANMDILPIIVFAILIGVVLLQMGGAGKPLLDLFQALNDLMMRLTKLVMKLGPIGVAALVAELVWLKIDIPDLIYLVKYMVTVLLGLAIHGVIVLPLILYFIGGAHPIRYLKRVSPALLTAFSTDSSSATLPVTLEVTRERAGVPKHVGSFVLPLGATVNMDGTALYESVAAIFIAQAYLGHNLEFGQQLIVFMTATLAAIGAAGIPSAGIVMMLIVLKALNLPAEGVALVLAVDRIVDQCRTTINVWGDTVGAAVITRLEGLKLNVDDP